MTTASEAGGLRSRESGTPNEQRSSQLSAFMDGDLPAARELDMLLADESQAPVWGRYHLIRDALQNELPEYSCDISAAVRDALADEPTVLAPRPRPASRWQQVTGLAVAASVFAVAVVGFQNWQAPESASSAVASAPAMELSAPVSNVAATDEERARLEELLINHTEAVSANGLNVMLPYARVVSDRIELPVAETAGDEAESAAPAPAVTEVNP